jgi:hypothetical protein
VTTEEKPDFTVPVNGVEVGFRAFTSGQLILMQKAVEDSRRRARKDGEDVAMSTMMVKLLNIIEAAVITEDDLDHLTDSMASGKFNVEEIMTVLRQGKTPDPEPDDDADPVDKPRANKTRTKKA